MYFIVFVFWACVLKSEVTPLVIPKSRYSVSVCLSLNSLFLSLSLSLHPSACMSSPSFCLSMCLLPACLSRSPLPASLLSLL